MTQTQTDRLVAYLTLVSGLSISAVAVYYSVAGLISIFAAAVIPIAVMGVVLELSKLVATVWLKQNWFTAPKAIKYYLLSAVIILMFITSMGIFGYLSKAHLDQAVPTGDVAAKVSLIDEKIKTQRDNVEVARAALKQLDAAVDQTMARSTDEKGAERAVQIRRNQQRERTRLQNEIGQAQAEIARLNEQRAPIAAELRKVEAEVGPIKYIAAFIYGDNPDNNLLERAVRWVIIVIVIVFDPFAVALLLASQYSFQYLRDGSKRDDDPDHTPPKDDAKDWEDFFDKKDPPPEGYEYRGTWPFPLPKEEHNDVHVRTAGDDDGLDGPDTVRDESPRVDAQQPAQQSPVADVAPRYQYLGDADDEVEEPAGEVQLSRPVTSSLEIGASPEVAQDQVNRSVTAKADSRLKKIAQRAARKAQIEQAAPPGTPGEAWTMSAEETAAPVTDELDKIYREASAVEAKKKRSRGWLQSNFPTRNE